MAVRVVARGTGATLVAPATVQRLTALERAHPAGTRWQWQGQWQVVPVPLVGPVHTGAIAAAAVNAAWRAGRIVSDGHRMPLWPGAAQPATYDPATRTTTVRWQGASAFWPVLVSVLSGISAGFIASTLGLPAAAAVGIGAGVALAVGVAFVTSYLSAWLLGTSAPGAPGPGAALGLGLGVVLAVGIAVAVPAVLAGRRRRKG